MVLLRFAPSPTGPLHLGGLRMALYNFLFARKMNGKWILRIEDTDRTRYVPGSVKGIQDGLQWAGLEYDYGPGKGGDIGPFYQSERLDLYRDYAQQLLDSGRAYRCFCSTDKLYEIREGLAKSGSLATYDRSCLHLSDEEVARRVRNNDKHTIRLNDTVVPSRDPHVDLVFGHVRDSTRSVSTDPVLLKSDLYPTYHLASVVDDHEMGITHVLRGEEWLPSAGLHLNIYASLNLKPPKFAHIPILLNPNRTKMSKRHGDVQVIDYVRRGWEPSAILNWLALSGWGSSSETQASDNQEHESPDSTKVMTMQDLLSEFDLSVLTARSSVLDPGKLEYLNKQHLLRTWSTTEGLESLANRIHQQVKDAFPTSEFTTVPFIKKVILLLEGRLMNMQDIPTLAPYMFVLPDYTSPEANYMSQNIDLNDRVRILQAISDGLTAVQPSQWTADSLRSVLRDTEKSLGVKHKSFMMSLRHAICGMRDGPSLVDIMELLGVDRVSERLKLAAGL